jgi:hypothetical protein
MLLTKINPKRIIAPAYAELTPATLFRLVLKMSPQTYRLT